MHRLPVRDPEVFLFDEPLSNLDAKLRVQMRTEIKALHQRLKTTTIYVTHDQIEAMTMADRIVVMRDGVIEQVGSPLELYDTPANLFVAGFIGSPAMYFATGKIVDGQFVGDNGIITTAPTGAANGRRVICGVRPDQVTLGGTSAAATILVVEPTGAETQIVVQIGTEQLTCLQRERTPAQPGAAIHVVINADAAHFFDAETGTRL